MVAGMKSSSLSRSRGEDVRTQSNDRARAPMMVVPMVAAVVCRCDEIAAFVTSSGVFADR
jgi:hypothetical protein